VINYARELGLGERTGINQPGEIAGRLPSSLTEVDASHFGAAGEGIEVTPIQLATMVSAIANGGFLMVPHVPRTVQDTDQPAQIRRNLGISPEVLECLRAGMIAAVDHGTASAASDGTENIAGKTGTFPESNSNVGLFASYAPGNDARLVVVVVTRGPKESGPEAAGIAGAIYRAIDRL
jgi:cell division protein FtsI/penicillin-binding protein 2